MDADKLVALKANVKRMEYISLADIKMFFYFCRDENKIYFYETFQIIISGFFRCILLNHEKVCCCLYACAVRPACVVLGLLPRERGRRHAVLQPL